MRRAPGRPRDPRKRIAVLDAARALFFSRGIAAVTMEAVAQAAGVSKMTLYGLFADKSALFVAVAEQQEARLAAGLRAGLQLACGTMPPLRDVLAEFGAELLDFLNSAELRRFTAVMANEAPHFPELARRFHQAGPERGRLELVALLQAATARGEIAGSDAEQISEDFIGLLLGAAPLRQYFGQWPVQTDAQIRARAAHATEMLLRAYHR